MSKLVALLLVALVAVSHAENIMQNAKRSKDMKMESHSDDSETTDTPGRNWPDFTIVGGGSAGSVLAAGLASYPGVKVLVIARGFPADMSEVYFAPWWTTANTNPTYVNDNPVNTPQYSNEGAYFGSRQQYSPECNMPGGCTNTNGGAFGVNAKDYWDQVSAYVGDSNWDGTHMFANRRWTETYSGPVESPTCHGTVGGLNITVRVGEPTEQAFAASAASVLGIPTLTDASCASSNRGVGPAARNIEDGTFIRQDFYTQLAKPIADDTAAGIRQRRFQGQLKFVYGANARFIQWNGNDAQCITYTDQYGDSQISCPKNEIIITMGAINTPKFFMLNGIGDCTYLATLGIDCQLNNPNVGKHLKNQIQVTSTFYGPPEPRVPLAGYFAHFSSPQALARNETLPDLMIATLQVALLPTLAVHIAVLQNNRPQDEGTITLLSREHVSQPQITYNICNTHPEDCTALAYAGLQFRAILTDMQGKGWAVAEGATSAYPDLASYTAAITSSIGQVNYHLTGSMRMGPHGDPTRVLDSRGRIVGSDGTVLTGIRVGDISGNPIQHPAHAAMSSSRDVAVTMVQILAQDYSLGAPL